MSDLQEIYGIFLVGADDVRASMCQDCGGVPQADWLPYWVYDEFHRCTCLRCTLCGSVYGDSEETLEHNQAQLYEHSLEHLVL